MLAPAAHDKNLDLVPLVYNDVPDAIMGDPLRIKQVITNLINNAIKFTQSGEVVLRAMLDGMTVLAPASTSALPIPAWACPRVSSRASSTPSTRQTPPRPASTGGLAWALSSHGAWLRRWVARSV